MNHHQGTKGGNHVVVVLPGGQVSQHLRNLIRKHDVSEKLKVAKGLITEGS